MTNSEKDEVFFFSLIVGLVVFVPAAVMWPPMIAVYIGIAAIIWIIRIYRIWRRVRARRVNRYGS